MTCTVLAVFWHPTWHHSLDSLTRLYKSCLTKEDWAASKDDSYRLMKVPCTPCMSVLSGLLWPCKKLERNKKASCIVVCALHGSHSLLINGRHTGVGHRRAIMWDAQLVEPVTCDYVCAACQTLLCRKWLLIAIVHTRVWCLPYLSAVTLTANIWDMHCVCLCYAQALSYDEHYIGGRLSVFTAHILLQRYWEYSVTFRSYSLGETRANILGSFIIWIAIVSFH